MILKNKLLLSLIILSSFVMSGCATNQQKDFLNSNNVTVEKVDSKKARIGLVSVAESNGGVVIRGEIRRRSNSRGRIPGHMDIKILASDGQLVAESFVNYKRRSHRSRTAKFSLKLDSTPTSHYRIEVAHHYTLDTSLCCHNTIEN